MMNHFLDQDPAGYHALVALGHPLLALMVLPLVIVIGIWTLIIKGFALWRAARNEQKKWFVALLILNTLGILEVIYLIWFRADRTKKVASSPASDIKTESVSETSSTVDA